MKKRLLIWVGLVTGIFLIGIGLYFHYSQPDVVPGLADINNRVKKSNILLMGLDDKNSVEKGKVEVDSIVLARLAPEKRTLKFTSIPVEGEIYKGHETVEEIIGEVEKLTGETINYYLTVSYDAFINMVDSIGGIQIKVDKAIDIPALDLYLKKGLNRLTGQEALNYSRWFNYNTKSEIERLKRQQQVIKSLVHKILKPETLLKLPELFTNTLKSFDRVETNIDISIINKGIDFLKNRNDIIIKFDVFDKNIK
ncbi:LCP family protein [Halothermothrix orenii]|uniref:Cell envelope-related transcriptional attenuator n=1 Tax=Halothermothrix orenii (strain H 168 / OCM 544 / DSM 9562) TaxID=373903 RepID=B8D283_HALOH|nr:LCP family protein [Halothermothrix orenii]ACL69310.1 cell envelope-related transcriptional attenuator [Halothermothrix orenii H 168]